MRSALAAALWLGSTALIAAGLLAGVEYLTRAPIAAAEHRAQLAALAEVLPAGSYDNDPLSDRIHVSAPGWLGSARPLLIRRARLRGEPALLVIQSIAADGYAGPIELLLSVDREQHLRAVRVTAHSETPGLGDAIDLRRSDWITRFSGHYLGNPPLARWQVRKDGGDFDQFAGATITPRAVVGAIRRALQMVERHGDTLYAAAADSVVRIDDAP